MKELYSLDDSKKIEALCAKHHIGVDLQDFLDDKTYQALQRDVYKYVYVKAFKKQFLELAKNTSLIKKCWLIFDFVADSFCFNYTSSFFDTNASKICNELNITNKEHMKIIADALRLSNDCD